MSIKRKVLSFGCALWLFATPCFAYDLAYSGSRAIPTDKIETVTYEVGALQITNLKLVDIGMVDLIKSNTYTVSHDFKFTVAHDGYYSIYTNGASDTKLQMVINNEVIYSDKGGHNLNACFTVYLESSKSYDLFLESNGAYELSIQKGLPLSGSELKQNIEVFNQDHIVDYTNCYAYALNLTQNPFSKRRFRINGINPGELSGQSISTKDLFEANYAMNVVEKACSLDAFYLKNGFEKIGTFDMPDEGFYKIALVIDEGYDVHWLRQNDDGTWSHKQGISYAKDCDDNLEKIFLPHQSKISTYDKLLGYYQVKAN